MTTVRSCPSCEPVGFQWELQLPGEASRFAVSTGTFFTCHPCFAPRLKVPARDLLCLLCSLSLFPFFAVASSIIHKLLRSGSCLHVTIGRRAFILETGSVSENSTTFEKRDSEQNTHHVQHPSLQFEVLVLDDVEGHLPRLGLLPSPDFFFCRPGQTPA